MGIPCHMSRIVTACAAKVASYIAIAIQFLNWFIAGFSLASGIKCRVETLEWHTRMSQTVQTLSIWYHPPWQVS